MSRVLLLVALLSWPMIGFANPYSISGANWTANGVMNRLDMPAESLGYIWDRLQTTNRVQMVRPCNYWLFTNRQHQDYGYHEHDNTIHDATPFAVWIVENPGKIWLIGNEPDGPEQDNLTTQQYAAMYHTYYTFIRQHDPTARFAVGAKYGDSRTISLNHTIDWWTQVLSHYKNANGVVMPVDIWNFHCYALSYQRDVEDYMTLYVEPFIEWVRTVENGTYADAEIWNTEFGIGFWMGQLNARWVEPWMQRVCLRLEQSDVDRWFWFYGPWDNSGLFGQTSLIGPDGLPTILGQRYGDMARSWPNAQATPMPDPEVLPAPDEFHTDFADNDVSLWIDKAGPWKADNGVYRCDLQATLPFWGMSTLPPFRYTDVTIEARLRINQIFNNQTNNWVGLEVGRDSMFGDIGRSGWLIFLRHNRELGLHSGQTGTVATVPEVVEDAGEWTTIRFDKGGVPPRYDVYVNGAHAIRWVDMENRFAEGFVTLVSGQTNCSFDEVRIVKGSLMTAEVLNGGFEDGTDLMPWLRWSADGSSEATVLVQPGIGRQGGQGLRIGATLGGPMDMGIKHAVAGAEPGKRYLLQLHARATQSLDANAWVRVGIDPTGQVEDHDAETVVWVDLPTGTTDWHRLRTPLVTAQETRLGLWLRVGTTTGQNVTAHIDDVTLLDEQGSLDGNAILMVE